MLSQQVEGADYCDVGQDVSFGEGARVVGKQVSIGRGAAIGEGVVMKADIIRIGSRCRIEKGVEATWRGGNASYLALGDCCFIGWDSRILVNRFSLGDYGVLHNHLLANGDSELTVGNNAWVGQNGILNANSKLRIGNNVGLGAYSAVWTHGKFGAMIDGCLMHKDAPVVIEDDACLWRATVSPGVTVGARAVVLPGSVVTKDVPANSCFGGVPAVDITKKVKTYANVTMEQRFGMMRSFVREFMESHFPGRFSMRGKDRFFVRAKSGNFTILLRRRITDEDIEEGLQLVVTLSDGTTKSPPGVSLFDLTHKTYVKWLTDPEVEFMWFLLNARARFNPVEPK